MWMSSHGRTRLMALVDPSQVSARATYQLDQSFYALGPGGWFGRGLGNSMQKLFFLPEPHNDFVFAIVGEELGFVGAVAVVTLFALFLWRGTRAAVRAADPYAGCLAMGVTSLIVGNGAQHAVVTGFAHDRRAAAVRELWGSSLVITLFAVGILSTVVRRTA
jgi:cell division protein FtsW